MPREPIDIDGEQVRKLAGYGCTQEEVADFFGCTRGVIANRFSREFELGKANVRINVRKWQIRRARKGSDVMLIHLGKHYCGQVDRPAAPDELEDTTPHDEDGSTIDA